MKILRTPFTFMGQAIAQVFFQKAAQMYVNGENIQPLLKRLILHLAAYSFPIYLLLYLQGPSLFSFVFGENWREAGEYAQILAPWLFLGFVASPLSQVPIIVGKQAQMFRFSLIGNSMIIACIFYGGYVAEDIRVGFMWLSALLSIYLIFMLLWMIRIAAPK